MEKNIRSRLFIATVCGEHSRIIDEYGIGVELDQFCQAEKMDEPLAKAHLHGNRWAACKSEEVHFACSIQ